MVNCTTVFGHLPVLSLVSCSFLSCSFLIKQFDLNPYIKHGKKLKETCKECIVNRQTLNKAKGLKKVCHTVGLTGLGEVNSA